MLIAENIQLQEITLNEFLTEYQPEYKIEKQIQLEGIGRDFAVAKETGDIIAVTENGASFYLNFFDKQGNKRWSKTFEKEYYVGCAISQNGETISLHIGKGEALIRNIIFNEKGDILFEKELKDTYLIPSLNGKYIYKRFGSIYSLPSNGIEIYNLQYKHLKWDYESKFELNSSAVRFINEKECLIYISTKNGDKLAKCEIEKKSIKTKWLIDIPKQILGYAYFDNRKTAFFKSKIAFIGTNYFLCVDIKGKKLYESDGYFQSVDFIFDDKVLLMNENCTKIVDLNNLKNFNINFSLKNSNAKENYADRFISIKKVNSNYILSIERNETHAHRFRTVIIKDLFLIPKSYYLNEEFKKFTANGLDYIVLFKYDNNPYILIIRNTNYEN